MGSSRSYRVETWSGWSAIDGDAPLRCGLGPSLCRSGKHTRVLLICRWFDLTGRLPIYIHALDAVKGLQNQDVLPGSPQDHHLSSLPHPPHSLNLRFPLHPLSATQPTFPDPLPRQESIAQHPRPFSFPHPPGLHRIARVDPLRTRGSELESARAPYSGRPRCGGARGQGVEESREVAGRGRGGGFGIWTRGDAALVRCSVGQVVLSGPGCYRERAGRGVLSLPANPPIR